jgi:hypothetical protein
MLWARVRLFHHGDRLLVVRLSQGNRSQVREGIGEMPRTLKLARHDEALIQGRFGLCVVSVEHEHAALVDQRRGQDP